MTLYQWQWTVALGIGRNVNLRTAKGEDAGNPEPQSFTRSAFLPASPWPFEVPSGHIFGILQASIDTKFAMGDLHLPSVTAANFEFGQETSIMMPSSYLVLYGLFALPDHEGTRHFRPPMVMCEGMKLNGNITNGGRSQNIAVYLSGVLLECQDQTPEGVTAVLKAEGLL